MGCREIVEVTNNITGRGSRGTSPTVNASTVAILPMQVGIRYSFYERLPILMEISQAALPCALVALVSCAVKEREYVRDNDDVKKFSTQTMGVAFRTVPQ